MPVKKVTHHYLVSSGRGKTAGHPSGEDIALSGWVQSEAFEGPETLIYLDPRPFTRHSVGWWLQESLHEFRIKILPDPEQIIDRPVGSGPIRAVIINATCARSSSSSIVRLVSRVGQLLPDVPVMMLSDHQDLEHIREAFELGVRGYIPTSLTSRVAVEAVRVVCAGGTYAPASLLLSFLCASANAGGAPELDGFTQRQVQILACLRRGMANRSIASELKIRESTVKNHIRTIMKRLNATNRTRVVYLTRALFEGVGYQPPAL